MSDTFTIKYNNSEFVIHKPDTRVASESGSIGSERAELDLTTLQFTAEEDRHTEKATSTDGHSYGGTVVRGGVHRADSDDLLNE